MPHQALRLSGVANGARRRRAPAPLGYTKPEKTSTDDEVFPHQAPRFCCVSCCARQRRQNAA